MLAAAVQLGKRLSSGPCGLLMGRLEQAGADLAHSCCTGAHHTVVPLPRTSCSPCGHGQSCVPLAAGPYQMLFSQKSPLFAKGLNLLDRILYLSPCYIYVVSGIATPTFIAIPLGELCLPMCDSACWLHRVYLICCLLAGHRLCTAALQVLSSRLLWLQP